MIRDKAAKLRGAPLRRRERTVLRVQRIPVLYPRSVEIIKLLPGGSLIRRLRVAVSSVSE